MLLSEISKIIWHLSHRLYGTNLRHNVFYDLSNGIDKQGLALQMANFTYNRSSGAFML